MSKNFELMRRLRGEPEALRTPSVPPAAQTRLASRPLEEIEPDRPALLRVVEILRKHWRLSAMFAVMVVTVTTIITLRMQPVYQPEAQLEIEAPGTEVFSLQGGGASSSETEYAETKKQELENDQLLLEVVRRLGLQRNPGAAGPLGPDPGGDSRNASGLQLTKAEEAALYSLRQRLHVRRDTASHIINVSVAAPDPQLAAQLTNTLVDIFVEDTYKSRHDAITQSSEWLTRQLDDIRRKMEESNRALASFQKDNGIVELGEGGNTFSQELGELNHELSQARADRIQMESFLAKVKANGLDSLPQIGGNPVVQALTQKLADTRTALAQTLVVYGKNHPNTKKLQNQANELQVELQAQRKSLLGELNTSYAAARARERLLTDEVDQAHKQMSQLAQYNELKKEADAETQLYTSLYGRVKEAGISAASKSSNVRVVSHARILQHPTGPHRSLNLLLGLVAGVVGGLLLAFVREAYDTGIHTPEDARKYSGISAVSIVPRITADHGPQPLLAKGKVLLFGNGANGNPKNFLLEDARSPEAEALRGIQASIMFACNGKPPKVLLVVSAFPGEGKTTLALNLSTALAQRGSTCLVDADTRNPSIARVLGIRPELSIIDVLTTAAALEDALVKPTRLNNLTVLPANPGSPDPGALIGSEKTRSLIWDLRQRFEFVLMDSPPLLPYADARALAALADGVLLVCRAGIATRDAIVRSMAVLAQAHSAPVLQVVLNGADSICPDYRYYQYGYHRAS